MASYLSPAPPRILAHRGLAVDALENSARAFSAAESIGARFIETDAHATRDGIAVLWHDPTLERFDGSSERIDRLSWAELSVREVRGSRIQRLSDALSAFPSMRFNIDIKAESALVPVIEAIRAADATERVLLASFSDARRRRAARMLPGVASSVGSSALVRMLISLVFLRGAWRDRAWRSALNGAVAAQIPRTQFGIPVLTRSFIATAHRLGVEVHVWTINDAAEMTALLSQGVDGIVTDRADLGLTALSLG